MKKLSVQLLFAAAFLFQTAFSQVKNEKEERIKSSKFPENAIKIIECLPEKSRRLRFYRETDGDKVSYEAKFKYKGRRFSLEFSKNGTIEDIEVVTKYKHIPENSEENIESFFENNFDKHKTIKIQESYIYDSSVNPSLFLSEVLSESSYAEMNYEIIAEVRCNKKRDIMEFTFSGEGSFINSRILKPTSYEHILY